MQPNCINLDTYMSKAHKQHHASQETPETDTNTKKKKVIHNKGLFGEHITQPQCRVPCGPSG